MKKPEKHVIIFALLFAGVVLLYLLGGALKARTAVGDTIQNIAVFIGILPALGLFLNCTKEGRRFKKQWFDPLFKPGGEERKYWDENGDLKKGAGAAPGAGQERKKPWSAFSGPALLILVVFAVLALLVIVLTNRRGVAGIQSTSDGMRLFLDGITQADTGKIAEGAGEMFSGFLVDLQNILLIFALILLVLGVSYVVIRIRKKRNKYRWDGDDEE